MLNLKFFFQCIDKSSISGTDVLDLTITKDTSNEPIITVNLILMRKFENNILSSKVINETKNAKIRVNIMLLNDKNFYCSNLKCYQSINNS